MTVVPVLLGQLRERCVLLQSGVGDQDVDRAESLDGLGEQRLDVVLLGDVRLDRDGAAAGGLALAHGLGRALRVAVIVDHDRRAALGERDGAALAETGARAGDHGALVRKVSFGGLAHDAVLSIRGLDVGCNMGLCRAMTRGARHENVRPGR